MEGNRQMLTRNGSLLSSDGYSLKTDQLIWKHESQDIVAVQKFKKARNRKSHFWTLTTTRTTGRLSLQATRHLIFQEVRFLLLEDV